MCKIKAKALYLSVNVFSTKVLIGTLYFTSPNGDGTAILRGHPSHAKVQPPVGQRKYLHFSVIFKTPSIGPTPGIEPATSRWAVKRSTDWANPAAVENGLAPPYIADLSQYHLRNRDFVIPRFRTVAYGRHSLTYLGPVIWPRLDIYIFYRLNLWTFSKSVLNWLISQVCLTALVKTVFYVTTNNWVLHFIFYWLLHFIFIDNQISNCS